MVPCFRRTALELLLPILDLTSTAWAGGGLDSPWPKLLRYRHPGIIDATPVLHTRAVGAGGSADRRRGGQRPALCRLCAALHAPRTAPHLAGQRPRHRGLRPPASGPMAEPRRVRQLERVRRDGSAKLPVRLLTSPRDNLAAQRPAPCTLLAAAAWMLCMAGGALPFRTVWRLKWRRLPERYGLLRELGLSGMLGFEVVDHSTDYILGSEWRPASTRNVIARDRTATVTRFLILFGRAGLLGCRRRVCI